MDLRALRTGIIAAAIVFVFCPGLLAARSSPGSANMRTRTGESERVEYGLASWYGPGCRWHRTASGALYDDRKMTAAARTLPLGTTVKVTNLRNGRSVVVKVNDRGPWVRTRLIDLSRAAAVRLGFSHRGLARVKLTVLQKPPARHKPATPNEEVQASDGAGK
jgi:rare lipoprotein A (peptidoglycan hydrolase)